MVARAEGNPFYAGELVRAVMEQAVDPTDQLAVEDALRMFGADEVLVVGDDGMFEAIRDRVAIPVSRA